MAGAVTVADIHPVIRVVHADLGPDAQVRLVVSGDVDLARLRSVWVSSGAAVAHEGDRLRATTTVQALARAAGRAFGADLAALLRNELLAAISSWADPAPAIKASDVTLATDQRPLIMGVVNVTPDSFSDGGALYPEGHPDTAVEHGRRLVELGADIVDVGGESTRPGAQPVSVDEELSRVVPVIEALADGATIVSVDTRKPEVVEAAVAAGAAIVNDVSGAHDPRMLEVVAATDAAYVLMHSRGTPQDMQSQTDYADVVAEVYEFLHDGLGRCTEAGIDPERVIVDPGIGFAKTGEHNLALLRALRSLRGLGRPVLVGASRKSFLGALLDDAETDDRLEGSLACAALAVEQGAAILRVHDVAESRRVARVSRAVTDGRTDWPDAQH